MDSRAESSQRINLYAICYVCLVAECNRRVVSIVRLFASRDTLESTHDDVALIVSPCPIATEARERIQGCAIRVPIPISPSAGIRNNAPGLLLSSAIRKK